jgi:hypothetical protein
VPWLQVYSIKVYSIEVYSIVVASIARGAEALEAAQARRRAPLAN